MTNKKTALISLGPTCVAAEILKAGGLRTCTFGFDWLRSSSHYVECFLKMSPKLFVKTYLMNPSIQLVQSQEMINGTYEVQPIQPTFGFSYIHSPHRKLDSNDTYEYFLRSFKRLKEVIQDENIEKVFVIADYVNKPYASFLDNINDIQLWSDSFNSIANVSSFSKYSLHLIRINLLDSHTFAINSNPTFMPNGCHFYCHKIDYWKQCDAEDIRSEVYKKIATKLFGYRYSELWRPDY